MSCTGKWIEEINIYSSYQPYQQPTCRSNISPLDTYWNREPFEVYNFQLRIQKYPNISIIVIIRPLASMMSLFIEYFIIYVWTVRINSFYRFKRAFPCLFENIIFQFIHSDSNELYSVTSTELKFPKLVDS